MEDFDGRYTPQTKVKVVAIDAGGQPTPAGMEYIPAGGGIGLLTGAFYMDRYEVTKLLYDTVVGWASTRGYTFSGGTAAGANHPVVNVNWYDCVKWANARSEREGLTPVYYTDATKTTVYRTGDVTIEDTFVRSTANGYRLPSEGEWERAARADTGGTYWWGDTMTNADGNFSGSGDPFESASIRTTPVGYYNGTTYNLAGGGTFATNNRKNAFGLYDISGNVWEWVYDWHPSYVGSYRVIRGGAWNYNTGYAALSYRYNNGPANASSNIGFRLARGLP